MEEGHRVLEDTGVASRVGEDIYIYILVYLRRFVQEADELRMRYSSENS